MNTSNLSVNEPANQKTHKIVAWCLLGGLLFLRLPFLTGIDMFARPVWLLPVYEIGTYLFIACLIYWERKRLADFHIDKLSLIIIIFFKPLQTILLIIMGLKDSPLALPHWPGLLIWLIAISLAVVLWRDRQDLPRFTIKSLGWFGIGLMVGLITVLLMAYPGTLQLDHNQYASTSAFLTEIKELPITFSYQMGFAAINEEPLFRGFLWGFLIKFSWKNVWIWLFQAFLFVMGHFYYLQTYPISFWVIVPFGALVLGAAVWRSKAIASSLSLHAISNSLLYVTSLYLANLLR